MNALAHRALPSTIGPFAILRLIAEGGMSVVYLAANEATGERIALKTVRVPDEVYLSSLRREIHALSRVRHPGVVRIVDQGIAQGMPWYAMELLLGETLADHHARRWGAPLSSEGEAARSSERTTFPLIRKLLDSDMPETTRVAELHGARSGPPSVDRPRAANGHLSRTLTLVRRLCVPLAFLHGEGLVHCDLKPQNVFLRPGDLPVLMDFGLAWRATGALGREVPEVMTKIAGTPHYMAPEQIRMLPIDARTDLYALGCVLYELVTGRPPFVGGHDVLVRHLTTVPAAPSEVVDGVPPELDALILALLRKRPRDRIGHADDVIAALERLGAEAEPYAIAEKPRAYLYRPELAGREVALRELLAIVERVREGVGSCALIGGESGIGKTYVATEVARRVAGELSVVSSACTPIATMRGGGELAAFRPLLETIGDRCTSMGWETTDRLLGARGKVLASIVPALARIASVDDYPEPPDLGGPAARDHLLGALRDTIAAFAQEQPLLLLLDDLQWADELTLRFLGTLSVEWMRTHAVAILGTYRSDEAAPLESLLRQPFVERVTIGRLDENTVRAVVSDMLAIDEPPDPFVRFLARQSEGNPFFVAEYLRTAVSEGVLRRASLHHLQLADGAAMTASDVFEALPLPRTLRDLVGRRLFGLSAVARGLVDVACAIGRSFELETLQLAAKLDDDATMEAVNELLARQVMEPEDDRYRFVHDKLREVAYDALAADLRVSIHRAIAEAIEARVGNDVAMSAAALAHHWSLARVEEAALRYFELAGDRALNTAAYGEAEQFLRRALSLAERHRSSDAHLRARLESGLARAHFGLGDLAATERHGLRALDRLGHALPSSRAGWALALGQELVRQGAHLLGFGRGRERDESQRAALRDAAIAAGLMTHRYFYVDDVIGMLVASLRSVNLAERAAVEREVPRAYTLIGYVAGALGRDALASSYFARARSGAEALNDPPELAFSLAVESVWLAGCGRWAAAEDALRRAQLCMRGIHDPFTHELILAARGHVTYFTGRVDEAHDLFVELLRSARARDNAQHATWGLFSIARSHVARDRYDEALPLLEEAREALAKRPELQSEIICHGLLALTLLRKGHPEEAERIADETLERIGRSRPTGYPAVEGYTAALTVYLEQWETTRANGGDVRPVARRARRLVSALEKLAAAFPMAREASDVFRERSKNAERRS